MFGRARYVALLLVRHPDQHGQYRYLADNQRRHLDRIEGGSLSHLRSLDEVHMAVIRVISTRGRMIMVTPALFFNSKVDWIVRTAFSKGRQRKTILERPALIRGRSHFRF